ncbi:MAG: isopentenyl phosphate kinase [Candidatus Thorarchaeota archaeon]
MDNNVHKYDVDQSMQVLQVNNLTIVKLGGSVITHKGSSPPTINQENLPRIAQELKTCTSQLIVILGGGAHGHQAAHKFGFDNDETPTQQLLQGVPSIRHNMSLLSLEVETVLNEVGIGGIVIPPFVLAALHDREIDTFSLTPIQNALQSRLTVITHGDVCFDTKLGASILSGDTIAVYLARELKAKSLFIGTDVDGVLEEDPKNNPKATHVTEINSTNIDSVLKGTGPSAATDVTGGMAKKLEELFTLSGHDINIAIFNLQVPGRLSSLLLGEATICTRIQP